MTLLAVTLLAGAAGAAPAIPQASRPYAAVLAEQGMSLAPPASSASSDLRASLLAAAAAPESDRQARRWDYALALLNRKRHAEALGVLEVMKVDDPDLPLVAQFQLAWGTALAGLGREGDVLSALTDPRLVESPDACRLRLQASLALEMFDIARGQLRCALTDFEKLPELDQRGVRLDAARLAIAASNARDAQRWLAALPETDSEAKLLRGRAHALEGENQEARLLFERAEHSGEPAVQADAAVSRLELAAKSGQLDNEDKKALQRLLLVWRGDATERRALALAMDVAGSGRQALAHGATLMRYHRLGEAARPLAEKMGTSLVAALENPSADLESLGGLLWDYRDLLPRGADGDRMVIATAARFQREGLYERAAELLDYLLAERAEDQAKGPLSVDVASLYILAGQPERALDVLRSSAGVRYADPIAYERGKIEAVTLFHLRRPKEALAVLQDVPGSGALVAEIAWEGGNWAEFAAANRGAIPAGKLDDVGKAALLRQAIALAMLQDQPGLSTLGQTYAAQLADEPIAPLIRLLSSGNRPDAGTFAAAMAALPRLPTTDRFGELLVVPRGGAERKSEATGG